MDKRNDALLPPWQRVTLISGFVLLAAMVTVGCLIRPLNRDEHQFVAAGALLARTGAVPYSDYPFFHLPNLAFIYAGLFLTNGYLLLTARAFNIGCAILLLGCFVVITVDRLSSLGGKRWFAGLIYACVVALTPLFRFTAGRAWNHDLPTLATAVAAALIARVWPKSPSLAVSALCGSLFGIAAGTRISFVPLALPFLLVLLLARDSWQARWQRAAIFAGCAAVFLLPAFTLFAKSPQRFIFDNLTYNRELNLKYRETTVPDEVAPGNKVLFPLRQVIKSPSSIAVIAIALYLGLSVSALKRRQVLTSTGVVIFAFVPFLLLGAWLPNPSYRQYYYPVIIFLLLALPFMTGELLASRRWTWHWWPLLLFAIISLAEASQDLPAPRRVVSPSRWYVFIAHKNGHRIARVAGAGPVLTLAPIAALEGKAAIYKEFATGPFAWRTTPFLSLEDRRRYGFIGPEELPAYLNNRPPKAILTGYEVDFEEPFVEYARKHLYRPEQLLRRKVSWIQP
ncbi:MAG: hypothetical protein JO354_12945 [Verrucomicrobia bacterium]|nr:hypothetical protein [Verrucomicrobiota bacterium]